MSKITYTREQVQAAYDELKRRVNLEVEEYPELYDDQDMPESDYFEPASLGFPVTVLGARTYIPRIPFLSFCGLLEEAKASEAERRRVEEQKRVLAIMEDM